MGNENKKGFFILCQKAFIYHIGAFLCLDTMCKEVYFFCCIGKLDISIGYRWKGYKNDYGEDD